jgi:hypothetical protein
MVDGESLSTGKDRFIAVGDDWDLTPSFLAMDALVMNGTLSGGVEGETLFSEIEGAADSDSFSDSDLSYAGNLDVGSDVNDSDLDFSGVEIESGSEESSIDSIVHPLNGSSTFGAADFDLAEMLYLPQYAERETIIFILH